MSEDIRPTRFPNVYLDTRVRMHFGHLKHEGQDHWIAYDEDASVVAEQVENLRRSLTG